MFSVISPAKTQDFSTTPHQHLATQSQLLAHTAKLHQVLKKLSVDDIAKLMSISDKLAQLNFDRFQEFDAKTFNEHNSKPALLAFHGDVYRGLQAETLNAKDLNFAQQHLGILSGFYGLLRPLDLMQPYRLEMSIPLPITNAKNLYDFWRDTLTAHLDSQIQNCGAKYLVNLASEEYSKAINVKNLSVPMIKVDFKEKKNGQYKVIGLFAKYARGLMARYIIDERCKKPVALLKFARDGYRFNEKLSTPLHLQFTREM